MVQESNNLFSQVPESIMSASRREFNTPTEMEIIDGTLPQDLQGYVFMIAPVGSIDSKGLPYKDGNTFLSGDGMIYCLDFTQPGHVRLKTQIAKPDDYRKDQEIENMKSSMVKELLKFRNYGVVRFSLLFGSRNLLNTAFLPVKFSEESSERLLVTYDAGRPHEIDTETLSVGDPVGKVKEWRPAIDLSFPNLPFPFDLIFPFKPILSTAHPVFDTYTQQMFTVNYGRSLGNFLGKEEYKKFLRKIYDKRKLGGSLTQDFLEAFFILLSKVFEELVKMEDFVNLIRWDGTGSLRNWNLINPDKSPIKIKQSMHQIGITEDYVVLLDTSFTVGIEHLLSNLLPPREYLPLRSSEKYEDYEKQLRELFKLTLKPSEDSTFYIVRRDDLKEGKKSVVAQKLEIPGEASHFLVDYKNPEHQITLHVAHIAAWDVAEWLRKYDQSVYGESLNEKLYGMQQCGMDISWMQRYVVDVSGQEPTIASKSKEITHDSCTWGPGLFTYLDRLPSSGKSPDRIDDIYWISFGLWRELMTDAMLKLYENYPYRKKSLTEILRLGEKGVPATLFRLHTSSNESMAIADYYEFPEGHIALSPQFVPSSQGKESSTNGYIICLVFTPEPNSKGDQIWIFDASNLAREPLCRLYHPELNFGFSLHSQYLKDISSQEGTPKISPREDYQKSVENLLNFIDKDLSELSDKDSLKRAIQDLFEDMLYSQSE